LGNSAAQSYNIRLPTGFPATGLPQLDLGGLSLDAKLTSRLSLLVHLTAFSPSYWFCLLKICFIHKAFSQKFQLGFQLSGFGAFYSKRCFSDFPTTTLSLAVNQGTSIVFSFVLDKCENRFNFLDSAHSILNGVSVIFQLPSFLWRYSGNLHCFLVRFRQMREPFQLSRFGAFYSKRCFSDFPTTTLSLAVNQGTSIVFSFVLDKCENRFNFLDSAHSILNGVSVIFQLPPFLWR
jgi:hypothetical protein